MRRRHAAEVGCRASAFQGRSAAPSWARMRLTCVCGARSAMQIVCVTPAMNAVGSVDLAVSANAGRDFVEDYGLRYIIQPQGRSLFCASRIVPSRMTNDLCQRRARCWHSFVRWHSEVKAGARLALDRSDLRQKTPCHISRRTSSIRWTRLASSDHACGVGHSACACVCTNETCLHLCASQLMWQACSQILDPFPGALRYR